MTDGDDLSESEKRARDYQEYVERKELEGKIPDPDRDVELNESVRVRLNRITKKEWEAYVNTVEGVTSLSELVRMAVAKEMAGSYDEREDIQEQIIEIFAAVEDKIEEEAEKTRQSIIDEGKLADTIEQAIETESE